MNEKLRVADLLLRRAVATLDLSQVLAVSREQTGIEVVLALEEIFDRLPPIDLETIPDAAAVAANELTAWTLPYTDLTIVKLAEGPSAGQFVFSSDTVVEARELYDTVRFYGERMKEGSDLFRFYTLTPGDLLPPKWYYLIEKLPFWAQEAFYLGHALWQWVGILVTLVVLFGGWWLLARAFGRRGGPDADRRGLLRRLAAPVLLIGVAFLAKWVIVKQINVSGSVLVTASTVLEGIAYVAAAWTAYVVCAGVGERIAASSRIGRTSLDASLIRLAARVAGIAAAITFIFFGATQIGLPVYGVIAGLGVGGLALGLAARPTLENLIGGFILYADRPVRVGEFCKFGDKLGMVEQIGLRSTRIRALDRTLITVPNAEFSNMELINFTRRDQTLLDTVIGLRYDTTPAQMHTILGKIRALLEANPEVIHDTIRVRFQELGTHSLGIGIRAHVRTPHTTAFLEVQEGILFGILKIIEDAGAQIAVMPQMTFEAEPARASATTAAGERRRGAFQGGICRAARRQRQRSPVDPVRRR